MCFPTIPPRRRRFDPCSVSRRRQLRRTRSPGPSASCWRSKRRNTPWSCSSTTSSGQRRRFSTWSSTSRCSRAERRPQWPVVLRLEPLPGPAVDELLPAIVPGELRERIARAAGGNPLFVTEMVAMAREAEGEVAVPPNLKALLAARLDRLEQPERSVLERGAVEGEIFHRGAVQALSDDGQVTPRLASLVRKELIRPDKPLLRGEDAFRFRHLLIRDAAYDALPKAIRADLHQRFAHWLEEHGSDLVELDEILGHHLEQAVRYKADLGQADPELADAAGKPLASAR